MDIKRRNEVYRKLEGIQGKRPSKEAYYLPWQI
jgi:hypothetical protein